MRNYSRSFIGFAAAAFIIVSAAVFAGAQTNLTPSRITQAIDPAILTVLRGNTHPLAQARFDRGPAPASLPMQRMLLVLKRSAEQESALDTLLEQQQDASSPNYHHWLTPQQFGQQFGPSDQDIQTIASWLQSQGFQIDQVSNGRTVIEFSGTAGEVQSAFHTAIHQYAVNGQNHWANSSDPEIPTALTPVVAGIDTLYNFPRTPLYRLAPTAHGPIVIAGRMPSGSQYTFPTPCSAYTQPRNFAVGPFDFATIYNVLPLWNQNPAINGSGETIAIADESDINKADVEAFQGFFGLAVKDPTIITNGPDPGLVPGDETEADVDVEWAGAAAPGANIDLVVSQTTEASVGVDLSAQYAVDNNVASVLSESYGVCEFYLGNAGNQFYNQLWQQAAAQGITVVVATGDSGSSLCDGNAGSEGPAQLGLSVNGIASTPYDTAMGGTDFNQFDNAGPYWNISNTTPPGSSGGVASLSAKGYIPEMAWNDTCTNQELFSLFGVSSAAQLCNNPSITTEYPFLLDIAGGSGGMSSCTSSDGQNMSSCTTTYTKPAWQTTLTPNDGVRDLPDVAMFASNGLNGSFYVVCEADLLSSNELISVSGAGPSSSCDPSDPNTGILGLGGTSVPTPIFAGIMAMVDQAKSSPQGNANYILYKLAAQSGNTCTSAANPAGTCVFYDIPSGSTISMPCVSGTPNCTTTSGDQYGVLTYDGNPAYNTASGYDLATGLGSVNVANLVNDWRSFSLESSVTTLTLNSGNPVNVTHGQPVSVVIGVAPGSGGAGTPSGNVSLIANTALAANSPSSQDGVQSFSLSNGTASGTTNSLPGGSYTVQASYPGDGTFGSSTSSGTSVTVNPESSKIQLEYELINPNTGAITNSSATTAVFGTPSLLRVNVTSAAGDACANNAPGSIGCPTGSVVISDNGNSLGTFALNSQGYAEDQLIDLVGGAHSIAASYPGDSSYNAPSPNPTTQALTITPAATTTSVTAPNVSAVGSTVSLYANISADNIYSQHAPSGTVMFFSGATELASAPVTGSNVSGGRASASASASTTSLPHGTNSITAQYSGDASYAASTSTATSVTVLYPTTMNLSSNPANVVYGQGTNVAITAIVSTGEPASNAALKPAGTISFTCGSVTGSVTTITGQDASGNWILQASFTAAPPQNTETFCANYSGDSNYAASSQITQVTVTVPDFTLSLNSAPLLITAGQTGTTTLTITPLTSYTTTVDLSCGTALRVPIPGTTCTISPSSVTLSNSSAVTATLTLATLAPSTNLTAQLPFGGLKKPPIGLSTQQGWWDFAGSAGMVSFAFLVFSGTWRRRRRMAVACAAFAFVSFAVGCGGGSGSGSGGSGSAATPPSTGPVLTTTTLTAGSSKIALGASTSLVATVKSTGSPTGGVSFNDASFPSVIAPYVTLANGVAQAEMNATGSVFPGTHAITAQYMGDGSNLPSQSGSIDIVVTGNNMESVTAQTGPLSHFDFVNVTIQ